MVKQSPRLPASYVSANSDLQTLGRPGSEAQREEKRNKQGHKNITLDQSLDNVMTSAGTLKLNFSEAFKTLLNSKHSYSRKVK